MASVGTVESDIGSLSSTDQASVFLFMWTYMTDTQKQAFVDYQYDNHGVIIQIDTPDGGGLSGYKHIGPTRLPPP